MLIDGDMLCTNSGLLISKMKSILHYDVKIFHKLKCSFFNIFRIATIYKHRFGLIKCDPMNIAWH